MFLTPNEWKWAKCPHCDVTINTTEGTSIDALGNQYYVTALCPNVLCRKAVGVKIRIIFEVQRIKLEE